MVPNYIIIMTFFRLIRILRRNAAKIPCFYPNIPIYEKKFRIIRILGVKCGKKYIIGLTFF